MRILTFGAVLALASLSVAIGCSDSDESEGDGGSRADASDDENGGAGGATDGSSNTSSQNSSFEGQACAASEQDANLTAANLLFVVDRSGSMNCNAPQYTSAACTNPEKQEPGSPSKWQETQEAIAGALESLVGADNVSVGVSVFPKPDAVEQCLVSTSPDVAIKRLTTDHKATIDTFLEAVAPQGETPIAGASLTSYQYLADQLVAGKLEGNTFVVLFTDGEETCDVDEGGEPTSVFSTFVDTKVDDATQFNIRTFVIGAPGSEGARSSLAEIAFQGETAASDACSHGATTETEGDCHFDMTESDDFIGDLADVLGAITSDKALSCVYNLPADQGVDLNKVNVSFIPNDGDALDIYKDITAGCDDGANGWQYSDDQSHIVLCGDICDQVKDSDGSVRIVLGCPTQVVR